MLFKDCNLFIFDWSGTISDDRQPVYKASSKVFSHFGLKPLTFDEWLKSTRMTLMEDLAEFGVEFELPFVKKIFKESYSKECEMGTCPVVYDDAKETLNKIKSYGKKMAIVSSHPKEILDEEIEKYGLQGIFDEVVGWAGDKTEEMLGVCKKLNESTKETCYIGDMVFDVRSAKKAGVMSVALTTGYHDRERLEKENPDFIIDSLSELIKNF